MAGNGTELDSRSGRRFIQVVVGPSVGACRRKRQRQVDPCPIVSAPNRAGWRRDRLQWQRRAQTSRLRAKGVPWRRADHISESGFLAQSAPHSWRSRRARGQGAYRCVGARSPQACGGFARSGRPAARPLRPLSASAIGRRKTAHRHRARARDKPGYGRVRRASVRS